MADGNAERLAEYWAHGAGAAKIRWGEPHDFDRCVRVITEELGPSPAGIDVKGYCSNLHMRALGVRPGQEKTHAAAPALPALVTIPNVDIVAAGTWKLSSGEQTFTPGNLAAAIQAAQCPAVGSPVIKLGHTDPRFDGEPTLGRVKNLRLSTEGNKITGDLAGMPGWLGAVAASAYPRRSIEGLYDFTCQIGHTHPFVITGLALLGVTPPGVGVLSGLPDVAALYGVRASAAGRWETQPQAAGGPVMSVTEADVRRAYFEAAGTPLSHWITELMMDPAQLIVADEADGMVYRVPFEVNAGTVEFGQPVRVTAQYADVAAARGTGRMVVFANAAASWAYAASASVDGDGLDASWDNTDGVAGFSDLTVADLEAAEADLGWAPGGAAQAAAKLGTGARWAALKAKGMSDALLAWIGRRKYGKARFGKLAAAARKRKTAHAAGGLQIATDGTHAAWSGTHSHLHAAMGSQGGDATHAHEHTHGSGGAPDSNHAHAHAGAGPAEGGSDVQLSTEQMAQLRTRLGLKDDEEPTFDQILAALGPQGASGGASGGTSGGAGASGGGAGGAAGGAAGGGQGGEPAPAPLSVAAAAALPQGVIAIDRQVWEQTQQQLRQGVQARQAQLRTDRDTRLRGAVTAGKFPISELPRWEQVWDTNPEGTAAIIDRLTPGVVATSDIGSAGGEPEGIDEEYQRLFPPEYKRTAAQTWDREPGRR